MKKITLAVVTIVALTISSFTLGAEIYLNCADVDNANNRSKIFIDTDSGKGSVEMNSKVLHSCEIGKSATHYSFNCPSFDSMGPLDRSNLTFRLDFGIYQYFKCSIDETEVETLI